MEVILGAADFDAHQAERYGWVNQALPDAELDEFVASLARRIASFPADAVRSTKGVLNGLALPGADAIRADARRFHQLVASDAVKARTATLFAQGCRPAARWKSTSAAASDPYDRKKRPGQRQSALTSRISRFLMLLCSNASSGMCTPTTISP
jgi:hypothetical protein